MKISSESKSFPDELRIVPAESLPKEWHISPTTEWRMEKSGELKPLRIGRRRFYRLIDLRVYLECALKKPPIEVPWDKYHESTNDAK